MKLRVLFCPALQIPPKSDVLGHLDSDEHIPPRKARVTVVMGKADVSQTWQDAGGPGFKSALAQTFNTDSACLQVYAVCVMLHPFHI